MTVRTADTKPHGSGTGRSAESLFRNLGDVPMRVTPRGIILASLVIGIVVRAFIGIFFTFPTDINYWIVVSDNLTANESLYELPGYYYSPAWGYFMSVFTAIINFLGIPFGEYDPSIFTGAIRDWTSVVPSMSYAISMKTMMTVFDILVGYVIYKIGVSTTLNERKSAVMFAVWFLCPLTFIMSCDRLMFENVEILFFLLAFYMMLQRRPVEAGLMMGVSLMLKPYGIFLAFIMIAFAFSQSRSLKYTAEYVLATVVSVMIIMLPVFVNGEMESANYWFTSRADSIGSGYNISILLIPILGLVSVAFTFLIVRFRVQDPVKIMLMVIIPTAGLMIVPGNVQYYLVLLAMVILVAGRLNVLTLFLLGVMGIFALIVHIDLDSTVFLNSGLPGAWIIDWLSDVFAGFKDMDYGLLKTASAAVPLAIAAYMLLPNGRNEVEAS